MFICVMQLLNMQVRVLELALFLSSHIRKNVDSWETLSFNFQRVLELASTERDLYWVVQECCRIVHLQQVTVLKLKSIVQSSV